MSLSLLQFFLELFQLLALALYVAVALLNFLIESSLLFFQCLGLAACNSPDAQSKNGSGYASSVDIPKGTTDAGTYISSDDRANTGGLFSRRQRLRAAQTSDQYNHGGNCANAISHMPAPFITPI